MAVTRIEILTHGHSTDRVWIYTNYPTPFPLVDDGEFLQLQFETPPNRAITYVKEHFPGVPTVEIDSRDGSRKEILVELELDPETEEEPLPQKTKIFLFPQE